MNNLRVCAHACVCVPMWMGMYVCVYKSAHMCMNVYACMCAFACISLRICVCMAVHIDVCTCACTLACVAPESIWNWTNISLFSSLLRSLLLHYPQCSSWKHCGYWTLEMGLTHIEALYALLHTATVLPRSKIKRNEMLYLYGHMLKWKHLAVGLNCI